MPRFSRRKRWVTLLALPLAALTLALTPSVASATSASNVNFASDGNSNQGYPTGIPCDGESNYSCSQTNDQPQFEQLVPSGRYIRLIIPYDTFGYWSGSGGCTQANGSEEAYVANELNVIVNTYGDTPMFALNWSRDGHNPMLSNGGGVYTSYECGVYYLEDWIATHYSSVSGSVPIEPWNEPDHQSSSGNWELPDGSSTTSAATSAADYGNVYADATATNYWSDKLVAGTFAACDASGEGVPSGEATLQGDYIYYAWLDSGRVMPSIWSCHDYEDVNNAAGWCPSPPSGNTCNGTTDHAAIASFKSLLATWNAPTSNVWITEADDFLATHNATNDTDAGDDAKYLAANDVQQFFWYQWYDDNGSWKGSMTNWESLGVQYAPNLRDSFCALANESSTECTSTN